MAVMWFFKNSFKKNMEKWIFFGLFALMSIILLFFGINLPYFKNSVYAKKINRTTDDSRITRIDTIIYDELLKQPVSYSKLYVRDAFSPVIDTKTCSSCGKAVATNLDVCPFCSFSFDNDLDGMPNTWEKRYSLNAYDPEDAYSDRDGDSFSNLAEYHEGTNPLDPTSKPEEYNPLGRYRLVRVFKKPLQLLFEGYMQLPDGSYSFVINSGASSKFVKIGEDVDGYVVVDFEKELVAETRRGVEVRNDVSRLRLMSENGDEILLKYHQVTAEKELWAQIEDTESREVFDMQTGDKIGVYTISVITDEGIEVKDDSENTFKLKYERRSQ
ncbi:MAG: hypothetical protein AB1454_03700 [Candidatus Auribacterota bacterium]